MKKLIATAVFALTAGSANAFNASFDAYEYYEGLDQAPAVTTVGAVIDPTLHQEGTFPAVHNDHVNEHELGSTAGSLDDNLYINGNFPS